jgi:hypothetical protein
MPSNQTNDSEATARELMLLRGLARGRRLASFEAAIRRQRRQTPESLQPAELQDASIVASPTPLDQPDPT